MSNQNKTLVTHQGVRKPPVDGYVGVAGVWKKIVCKFIAVKGKWIETFDNETDSPGAPGIHSVDKRGVYPGEIITVEGLNLEPYPVLVYDAPENAGVFYPLYSNLLEIFENTPNAKISNVGVGPDYEYGGVKLNPNNNQAIEISNSLLGGIGFVDLLGLSGDSLFNIAFCYRPDTLPPIGERHFLFYMGKPGNRFAFFIESAGDIGFYWEGKNNNRYTHIVDGFVITPGNWMGVSFTKNANSENYSLTIRNQWDQPVILEAGVGDIRMSPTMTHEEGEIYLGFGYDGVLPPSSEPPFNTSNTHPAFSLTTGYQISQSTNSYRSAQPGEVMNPNTGIYVVDVSNYNTYDLQVGVGEPGGDLSLPAGVIAWCMNTINGRKFNHQTGGGTNWSTSIPPNSVISVVYDSNLGSLEFQVNGISRGEAFAAGSILVPVKLTVSGRGNTAASTVCDIRVTVNKANIVSSMVKAIYNELPLIRITWAGDPVYSGGTYKNVFISRKPTPNGVLESVSNPAIEYGLEWLDLSKQQLVPAILTDVIKNTATSIAAYVSEGFLGENDRTDLYIRTKNSLLSNAKRVTVKSIPWATQALNIDFATASDASIRENFIRAHKAWGGANGGVIAENVKVDRNAGGVVIKAQGDNNTGPQIGVNKTGGDIASNKRIGGCLVTKKYFGPGSYKVVAKLPVEVGVVSAFWTFHYEEGYAPSSVYSSHLSDGLSLNGNVEDGFYTVRNHEIDIEIPTALKGAADMEIVDYRNARFNTWQGENRDWDNGEWSEYTDNFTNHGVVLNDGAFHEFRFDWYTGDNARVEFFIDGVLKETNLTNIPDIPGRLWVGLWFPSGSSKWAGKQANFIEEQMVVKSISITPFDSPKRHIGETYPNDVYRDFFSGDRY